MNRQDAKDAKEPGKELDDLIHRAIGAAIEVHRHLGPGFLESVYEEALAIELTLQEVSFRRQVVVPLHYKGKFLSDSRLDLLVEGQVIIELKAVACLLPVHAAQLLSYLRAGGLQIGLLINFNVPVLRHGIRRVILTP
jgi:GxxExxY protein